MNKLTKQNKHLQSEGRTQGLTLHEQTLYLLNPMLIDLCFKVLLRPTNGEPLFFQCLKKEIKLGRKIAKTFFAPTDQIQLLKSRNWGKPVIPQICCYCFLTLCLTYALFFPSLYFFLLSSFSFFSATIFFLDAIIKDQLFYKNNVFKAGLSVSWESEQETSLRRQHGSLSVPFCPQYKSGWMCELGLLPVSQAPSTMPLLRAWGLPVLLYGLWERLCFTCCRHRNCSFYRQTFANR